MIPIINILFSISFISVLNLQPQQTVLSVQIQIWSSVQLPLSSIVITTILKNVDSKDALKVLEVRQDSVLLMEAARGVRSLAATKVLKAEQLTAKPMEEGGGASSLGALRAQRGRRTTA